MEESFETNPIIINEPNIKEFIQNRDISTEDFAMLEEFAEFPKKLYIEFHNFFNLLKERSVTELENDINYEEDFEKKKFLELLLNFTKKYDWAVSHNLIRVFERQKNN